MKRVARFPTYCMHARTRATLVAWVVYVNPPSFQTVAIVLFGKQTITQFAT